PRGLPRVLLVAHLDTVHDGPGASDNGSGVAVLLELARALRGEVGVLLAVTGAEERVETGSRTHLGAVRLLRGLSREGRALMALGATRPPGSTRQSWRRRGSSPSPPPGARWGREPARSSRPAWVV
ncbi:MAG: M28 family peptidase, partial [Actinobacteria bacterium]|nr:M28 family peptidase [Actinomycetota bacterium]